MRATMIYLPHTAANQFLHKVFQRWATDDLQEHNVKKKTELGGFHLTAAASSSTDIKWRYPGLYFCYVKCWKTNNALRPPQSHTAKAESSHLASVRPFWLIHFKGELQCQMLFIQIQFVSSLRRSVFYTRRFSPFFFFFFVAFLFFVLLLWQTPKTNTLTRQYLFNRVMWVFLEMCLYMFVCFCLCYIWMWVLTVHESGVSVNKTITVLPVCPRCHFTLAGNPQITASSHELDRSCFCHYNLK